MIRIYTRRWCEDSAEAKKFLEERHLPFEEIDIEKDPKASEFVMSVNEGKQRTPTFEINGRTFHCSPFDERKLARELDLEK
ncbi:MAG TPA: glutaredoxin domain-containing protein [Terriglobia bacterium]|nr:glutaredoxin domain-containing protein [Terriglobia bacterium]